MFRLAQRIVGTTVRTDLAVFELVSHKHGFEPFRDLNFADGVSMVVSAKNLVAQAAGELGVAKIGEIYILGERIALSLRQSFAHDGVFLGNFRNRITPNLLGSG